MKDLSWRFIYKYYRKISLCYFSSLALWKENIKKTILKFPKEEVKKNGWKNCSSQGSKMHLHLNDNDVCRAIHQMCWPLPTPAWGLWIKERLTYVQNATSLRGLSVSQKYQLHNFSRTISEESTLRRRLEQLETIINFVITKELFPFKKYFPRTFF